MTEATEATPAIDLRSAILAEDDLPYRDIPVPEWGGKVIRIATMMGTARDTMEAAILAEREGAEGGESKRITRSNFRARLLVHCIVSAETGELIFRPEDAAALGRKSAKALDRLFDAACELNKMREKDIEELTGN